MKKSRLKKSNEEGYWKSFTDIMAGLLLVILLILMLLLLYMAQMNTEEHEKDYDYDQQQQQDWNENNDKSSDKNHDYDQPPKDSSGGGGGGGEDDPGDSYNEGIYVDVGHGKTAVFVTVVDEETKNVIKKEGILFELYANKNASGGLCKLHTYYPTKIEYKQFQTTAEGTFFLPEKISNGWYSFHNLKAPEGYDLAENVDFEITEALDWDEPFLVKIPMSPVKGKICIQDLDAETGAKIGGQKYVVHAAEDIVTLDGTVRYKKGEKVGTIKCDEKGYGESKKLYLGKYTVTQTDCADFYALNKTPVDAELTVEKVDKTYTVKCTKTKVELKLKDNFNDLPISGAEYSITDKENLTTDETGTIVITDLEKDKKYNIELKSLPEPYRSAKKSFSFTVSADGLVNGAETSVIDHEAYIIRLTVDVRDMLFGSSSKGRQVRLTDSTGQVIDEWSSADEPHVCQGLEPGKYTVEITNIFKSSFDTEVGDRPEPYSVVKDIWTWLDTLAVAGGLIVLVLAIVIIRKILKKTKAKREEKKIRKAEQKANRLEEKNARKKRK